MTVSEDSQLKVIVATVAAANCTMMKAGTFVGSIPEKVLVKLLAIVTAGLAKEVDEVNQ